MNSKQTARPSSIGRGSPHNASASVVNQFYREEDTPLDYVRVSGEISRAKAVVEWWNEDHPQRYVPWEWVEEMILAKHLWHSLARKRSGKALDHYARYQEFSKKLPRPLVDQLIGGR